jgi:hypothetical protein
MAGADVLDQSAVDTVICGANAVLSASDPGDSHLGQVRGVTYSNGRSGRQMCVFAWLTQLGNLGIIVLMALALFAVASLLRSPSRPGQQRGSHQSSRRSWAVARWPPSLYMRRLSLGC